MVHVVDRFEEKIRYDPTGCWLWTGHKSHNGYGVFWLNGKNTRAHRFLLELEEGTISKHLEPDHLCKNPACVNPRHIELVTHRENMRRGLSFVSLNMQKTHCKWGHLLSGKNVYHYKNKRECRACRYSATKKQHMKKGRC